MLLNVSLRCSNSSEDVMPPPPKEISALSEKVFGCGEASARWSGLARIYLTAMSLELFCVQRRDDCPFVRKSEESWNSSHTREDMRSNDILNHIFSPVYRGRTLWINSDTIIMEVVLFFRITRPFSHTLHLLPVFVGAEYVVTLKRTKDKEIEKEGEFINAFVHF